MGIKIDYRKNRPQPPDEPAPLCACGCGRSVNWHYIKGQWNTFIHNHNPRFPWSQTLTKRDLAGDPPLCACGCGQPVGWHKRDRRWNTYIKGHDRIGKPSLRRIDRGAPPLCACGCGQPVKWWNGSWKTYASRGCSRKGKKHSEESKEIMRSKAIERLRKGFPNKNTSIELMIADALTALNIEYEPQYRISRFTVDFFVPALSLAIEVQGDYWHANPKIYAGKPLYKAQIRTRERDKRKRAYFAIHPEYRFVELWESDIRASPMDCVSSIL